MSEQWASVRRAGLRWAAHLRGALIARVPAAAIERLAVAGSWVRGVLDSGYLWHGIMRCEIGRDVVALRSAAITRATSGAAAGAASCAMPRPAPAAHGDRRIASCRAREKLLDQRIYFGRLARGVEAWPDLQSIAAQLAAEIGRLRVCHPDRPVIVSPFHYVSQYANIVVVDELRVLLGLESMAVVSGVPRHIYGDDHALMPGIKFLYTYGDENRNGLGLRVARSLRRDGVAVLFSDVPPFALHRYPMETVGVSMFGRRARIHNGVFRIGSRSGAWLLPFYLRFERGRFSAELFEPLSLADAGAPQHLAQYIETALTDNFSDSIIAVHPSMYAFAAAR
jgi:hypothetical protein